MQALERDAEQAELARLRALEAYGLLDTPEDAVFDALTGLAARLCDTPMAVFTLLDAKRQWFKAAVGLSVKETPREIAFCAHTVARQGFFEIRDAALDAVFAANPLVTGPPHLRFYAGVPLSVEGGHAVGSLAVLDRQPRRLTRQQRLDLAMLGRQAVTLLEERRLRRLAEETTAQLRRQSDSLLAIAGRVAMLGAWELDLAGGRVVWSDVVAHIHGMPPGFSPGLDEALAYYLEPDRTQLAQAVATCSRTGEPFDFEMRLRPVDHSEPRWVRAIGEAVRDVDGRITHLRGACQDITERKHAESERAALEGQLFQAQKMESIGTLAGGIAHDFNNILGAVLGNVVLAKDALNGTGTSLPALDTIAASAARGRSLVQQILTFGRRQPTVRTRHPIRPLANDAINLLRSTLPVGQVQLDIQHADVDLYAEVDGVQLQQVLLNLCTNAWHALPAAGGRIVVGLDNHGPDSSSVGLECPCVHLWVEDNGCGIPQETRGRIFEPFFTTKPPGQGTGLGLSVAHGIVAAHGGAIVVDSVVGAGTVFHVYLPASAPPAPTTTQTTQPVAEPERLDGVQVLCVDDDPVMLMTMQALLERIGCQVQTAGDGQRGIDALQSSPVPIDLVITDFNMAGANGLALAEAAQRCRPGLPVILASGYITEALCCEAAAVGVRAIVQKERAVEDLADAVRTLVRTNA